MVFSKGFNRQPILVKQYSYRDSYQSELIIEYDLNAGTALVIRSRYTETNISLEDFAKKFIESKLNPPEDEDPFGNL